MTDARIAETFTLPSHGKIYEEEVNPEVILSSMTTKHEMLRLSTSEDSNRLMADIIDDCIQSDVGISAYDMCLADYQYLMYKLREVTFGNEYEMIGVCPYCGNREDISVDLDELEIKEFTEDILDMMEIILPISGDEIEITMQTPRSLDDTARQVKQARRKLKNKENPEILYVMLNSIIRKNGEDFSPIEEELWLRNLPLADTNAILASIDRLNTSFGMDLTVYHTCSNCGQEFVAPFRVNDSFFRPSVF